MGKTSTFVIDHERCHPSDWRPGDVLRLANFLLTGDLSHAAALSRLGVKLVLSEHHVPVGGTLQQIGYAPAGDDGKVEIEAVTDNLDHEICGEYAEVYPVAAIYRGPEAYAVRYLIGDGEGNIEGDDIEIFDSREKADESVASLLSEGGPGKEPSE